MWSFERDKIYKILLDLEDRITALETKQGILLEAIDKMNASEVK